MRAQFNSAFHRPVSSQFARAHSWRACAAILVLVCAACAQEEPPKATLQGIKLVTDNFGNKPFPHLTPEWQTRFNIGDTLFEQTFLDSQGLGPNYIRASCGACHEKDARGPGAVRKMVLLDADGQPASDQSSLTYGHTIRPQTSDGATLAIVPPDDTSHLLITVRMPPAVFGRGYLEAIDDAEIQRVEAAQSERSDGVSGRINWVTYASDPNSDTRFHHHETGEQLIGRFGLKARIATLDDFCADAYQGDMGLTSDMRPDELPNPAASDDELPGIDLPIETINAAADYMRLLRLPSREPDITGPEGAALFANAGCDGCHVPSMHTVPDYPIAELADIDAPIYSDLLVHDMGPDFADGLQDYGAGSSEWRTAPLLGLRMLRSYLHDGRASTVEEAIELHGAAGSEARQAVQAFSQLDADRRRQLLDFVSAL
jgi:CxxC motif-containing protein (DUF1111 family)